MLVIRMSISKAPVVKCITVQIKTFIKSKVLEISSVMVTRPLKLKRSPLQKMTYTIWNGLVKVAFTI